MKILSESLQQYLNFTEDSDPIKDMGIGVKSKIEKWLMDNNAVKDNKFIIRPNFQIDAYNIVSISRLNLNEIPDYIKFRSAIGGFYCDYNNLISLRGVPRLISGSFIASDNKLTDLKDGPKEVKGGYFVSYNKLTSLDGLTHKIDGDLSISNNKLKNLKGVPNIVNGNFYITNNPIETLEYFPDKVMGDIYCTYTKHVNEKTIRKRCMVYGNINLINK